MPGQHPPAMHAAQVEIYKTIKDTQLNVHVFAPENHTSDRARPAIVFFFGGGFAGGSPTQFEKHCEHLASRGMVAMTADYRVKSRQGTSPAAAIQDAKSAIRWVRAHAAQLGVDGNRLAAGGGSAGAYAALCTGVVPGLEEPGEDTSVSSVPNALVLFNPAYMGTLCERPDLPSHPEMPKSIAGENRAREGLPPTIMFFGANDHHLAGAQVFREASVQAGNRCELRIWHGEGHGFFNYGKKQGKPFRETLDAADAFLVSLGYLPAP